MATKVGPFGGGGGYSQDIDSEKPPAKLKVIEIWSINGSGGRINAICFTYDTARNEDIMSSIWGTDTGSHKRISIPSHVYVTRLTGKVDYHGVKSLSVFTSDGTHYGTYGDAGASETGTTTFNIPVVNSAIVAFFGRSSSVLHALGAYVVPKSG